MVEASHSLSVGDASSLERSVLFGEGGSLGLECSHLFSMSNISASLDMGTSLLEGLDSSGMSSFLGFEDLALSLGRGGFSTQDSHLSGVSLGSVLHDVGKSFLVSGKLSLVPLLLSSHLSSELSKGSHSHLVHLSVMDSLGSSSLDTSSVGSHSCLVGCKSGLSLSSLSDSQGLESFNLLGSSVLGLVVFVGSDGVSSSGFFMSLGSFV